MKQTALVLALLGTFSLSVCAQDAAKPAATTTPATAAASTTPPAKKHSHKHPKASKTATADATKAPADSTRFHPYGKDLIR
jgi:hypothetical protein